MRVIVTLLMMQVIVGCEVIHVDSSAEDEIVGRTMSEINRNVTHGIATAREVLPRNDVAIMPPSEEHVIWVRGNKTAVRKSGAPKSTNVNRKAVDNVGRKNGGKVQEEWALLKEAEDYSTKIGTVPMCYNTKCDPSTCGDLVPCENREKYSCKAAKEGEYCLEKTL